MLRTSFKLLVTAIAVVSATSACSSSSSDSNGDTGGGGLPAFNSIDTSVSCPAGQIGWNYSTGGGSLATAEGSALNGVQVLTASYGSNCNGNLANNEVSLAGAQCNGQTRCDFNVGLSYDPAYGCAKAFNTTWQCGSDSTVYSGSVSGESGGKVFEYDCGGKITILGSQTVQTCNGKAGTPVNANAASQLSQACNNQVSCIYPVPSAPSLTCTETYEAKWTCGDNPHVYDQIQAVNTSVGSGGTSTPFDIACSGLPAINVQQATWGGNCGVAAGNLTTQVGNACNGNSTGTCAYTVGGIPDPHYGCAKNFEVKYTCGDNPFLYDATYPAEAGGKTYGLSCAGSTPFTPGNTTVDTGQKACISQTCPYNQPRNPDTEQCGPVDNTRQNLTKVSLNDYQLTDVATGSALNPSVFNAGPTTISSNWPAILTANVYMEGPAVEATLEPWMTYLFFSNSGQSAEGFLCALTPIDVQKSPFAFNVTVSSGNKVLPSACFDARSNPWADAAARMGISEGQFRAQFTYRTTLMHFSFDTEGTVGVEQNGSLSTPLPNPPGFFYKAATNYTDFISFYQQRELTSLATGPNNAPWSSLKWSSNPPTEFSQAYNLQTSTSLEVNLDGVDTRAGSMMDINYFETVAPTIAEDIHWSLVGDSPINPLSPTTTNSQAAVKNLQQANLRATVEFFPTGQSSNSTLQIGTIPLGGGAPTGTTTSGTLTFPSAAVSQIFGAWKSYNNFSIKTCIDVDGVNTRAGGTIKLPDTTIYSGKINGNCNIQNNALTIDRTYIKYAIATQQTGNAVSSSDNSSKGDSSNSTIDGTGTEKGCTTSTSGASATIRCQATQQSGATGGGNFSRSFYSTSVLSGTTHTDSTSTDSAFNDLTGEALGYQLVSAPMNGNGFPGGTGSIPNPLLDLSVTPNWESQSSLFNTANSANSDVNAEANVQKAEQGIYGGHAGIGIGGTDKQQFGGFGALDVNFAVGISVASTFQWTNRSPVAYSCNGAKGGKCFRRTANVYTQPDAARECEIEGGQLANLVSSTDFASALQTMSGFPSVYNFWTGGQENYESPNAACAGLSTPTAACTAGGKVHFDWSDPAITEFGLASGTSNSVSITAGNVGTKNLQLTNFAPTPAGVSLNQTGFLRDQVQSQLNYGICQFDTASSTSYSEYHLDVPIGAGAGVTLQYCWPSEEAGVCLLGKLQFIGVAFEPGVSTYQTTLFGPSLTPFGYRGDTTVGAQWQATLLSGEVDLVTRFLFYSHSYKLYEYPGYALAQGYLANYDWPSQENF